MNISFLKEKGSKYFVFILVGLLVLVLLVPTSSLEENTEYETTDTNQDDLEEKLESVLSAMEGVGKVKVMITTESTSSSLFDSDNQGQKVCGVVVVAEGAGNASVEARILEAVKALFSVDAHKISIVKMSSQEGNQ